MNTVQKFFNLFSPFLYMRRYRNRENPFNIFRSYKIINSNTKIYNKKGIVLITPIRVSPFSNLFEGLIGTFFSLKGYDVRYFLCCQELCHCENITNLNFKPFICALCKKEQSVFQKTFIGQPVFLHDYMTNEELKEIRKTAYSLTFEKREDFIFDNIDLYDSIESGVMRYTQKSDMIVSEDIDLIRKCAFTSFTLSRFMGLFSKNENVYRLITSHGIYSSWGSILKAAQHYNVRSIVWGRGYIGQGNMFFGHDLAIQDDLKQEKSDVFKNIVLTDDKISIVKGYFFKKEDIKSKVDYVNYYNGIKTESYDIKSFYERIGEYNTIFGMFTNIPWDGQVFNKTESFPTTRIYLKYTLDWFRKNPDCLLVIRAHPAEVSRKESKRNTFEELLSQECPILPSNVIFLGPKNPITSYELAKHIDCSIMYGSSMAIELALRKIPVIHTGKTYISDKGIVYDVTDKNDYYRALDKAKVKQLEVSQEMFDNALKYGYYWIKMRHILDTSCNLKNLGFVSFNFRNKEEFMNDKFLNFVYNKITTNSRIVQL